MSNLLFKPCDMIFDKLVSPISKYLFTEEQRRSSADSQRRSSVKLCAYISEVSPSSLYSFSSYGGIRYLDYRQENITLNFTKLIVNFW